MTRLQALGMLAQKQSELELASAQEEVGVDRSLDLDFMQYNACIGITGNKTIESAVK